MSRYAPTDYRPRDRSRSPGPRFPDRRPPAASLYNGRGPDSSRGGADAPRGPRSQFDGQKPPLSGAPSALTSSRGSYSGRAEVRELRDAPPLSSDRGRLFKDRAFVDGRDRLPSRDRSPPRAFREARDYPPPRELEIPRVRRGSRDGPPSAGSAYSDGPSSFAPPFRDAFPSRGRGRGDAGFRGGRGRGGRPPDERDLFRRDRSPPPPRWNRDLSRDGRELDRRDDRRFDRREEDRPPEWINRERDVDRARRDQPQPRLETRNSNDSLASVPAQPVAAPHVNPERLALLESAGADVSVRKPSLTPSLSAAREPRREHPELPAYLSGRAETTINRYGSRGSSPPTQAPPVPAFTLSYASTAQSGNPSQLSRQVANEPRPSKMQEDLPIPDVQNLGDQERPAPPADAPTAPKALPQPLKALTVEPPPAAPKAPRALEPDHAAGFGSRLHGVRSWEASTSSSHPAPNAPLSRAEALGLQSGPANTKAPSAHVPQGRAVNHSQPVSPATHQHARLADLNAPTGPKVSRTLSAQPNMSPRPPFAFNQPEAAGVSSTAGYPRNKTPPPPSAPSGPRNRAVSVSPKVTSSAIPTAPRANRPPLAPRGIERGPLPPTRVPDRINIAQPRAPPTAPRGPQWNQWRRPEPAMPSDRTIPAKRDYLGEEKGRQPFASAKDESGMGLPHGVKSEMDDRIKPAIAGTAMQHNDRMDIDTESAAHKSGASTGHSSFFGKPLTKPDERSGTFDAADESMSTSEDEDLEELEDPALFEAKFERQKRELEAQLVDLTSRAVRATTPLESIARLIKLSDKDLEKFKEREQEMEVDEPNEVDGLAPLTQSSESEGNLDVVTPKNEDPPSVDIHETKEAVAHPARNYRRPSPEVVNLPYLLKGPQPPLHENQQFHDSAERQDDIRSAVKSALDVDMADAQDEEEDGAEDFAEAYRKWRENCEILDREREAEEALERQQSMEPGPELDVVGSLAVPMASLEGRRSHKFNSEYELEQAIKQSEETARLEQEKADLEARKIQADMEKEAVIPDQQTAKETQRTLFIDNNRLRDPETLTLVFAYEPPVDDFTENEQQIFIAAFKETPKKWSEIASLLPGREPRDCIRHYYANKWDGRFRDNRKRGKGKRGRGGKMAPRGKGSAAMADMSRVAEDLVQNMSDSGRPKRAAAPTNFGERELDAKASLAKDSPARKLGGGTKQENGDASSEKPVKRRRAMGEKPGRKPKAATAQPPLAQLAAAPAMSMSPNNRFISSNLPGREESATVQSLEDASLLANLHSSQRIHAEAHPVYLQEGFIPSVNATEELERSKTAIPTPSSKPSASSYWSVPEQSDFVKYIAHFGTDFAAIATHMGTKTQTMIKNHYQRSIDGGNRPELEQAAVTANDRRDRGDEMGAPPTPTPINKRKYDNPPNTVPRALASQSDSMDVDEPAPTSRPQPGKHASPPQFSMPARYTTSAQATPVQAPRTVPSPVATPAAVTTPLVQPAATARPMPHPLGSRLSMFGDVRPDSRPGLSSSSSFRHLQQATPTSQPAQPSRPVQDAHDTDFILKLKQEQDRAIRMQGHYHEQERQERVEPFGHRGSLQQSASLQRSPAHLSNLPQERKPVLEERPPSPPRSFFPPLSSQPRRSLGGSPAFGHLPLGSTSFGPNRMGFNPSPPKKEAPRPSSAFSVPPAPPPVSTPAPPPDPPKRSNLLNLLNSEPEEPKPAKRISNDLTATGAAPQRTASPAHHPIMGQPATPLISTLSQPRRETFGQSSLPPSRFRPNPFGHANAAISPQLAKQEIPMLSNTQQQQQPPQKQDWANRVLSGVTQSPSASSTPAPTLERDVRPYYQHRPSLLGGLGGPQRHNPSPPPHTLIGHSRTPSLTTQGPTQPPRDQRGFLPGQQPQQQQGGSTAASSMQSGAFPQQQQPPPHFGQPQPGQAQNHAHHAHNNSIGSGFPGMHQRNMSHDDHVRSQQADAARAQQREHERTRIWDERRMQEEQDRRMMEEREQQRRMQEDRRVQDQQRDRQVQEERRAQDERRMQGEYEDRRRREQHFMAQREHEQRQQQQQHSFGRPLPPTMQPPSHFGGGGFEPGPRLSMGGLREQSMREAENNFQQEQERMRRDAAFRESREREQQADEIRRHEQVLFPPRRTPMGGPGGFGPPPQPGQGRR